MTEAEALFARALALEDAGDPERALEHYRRVLALAPGHPDARHNHGLLLAKLGRLEEAERSHRSYVEAHPGSGRARADLADILLALGRYQPTIEALDSLQVGGADSVPLLIRRGVALASLKRFDEARAAFALAWARVARQSLGDLLLDAIHHSAMTTACDALGAGLPVLTLRGRRSPAARVRACCEPPDCRSLSQQTACEPGVLAGYRERLARSRRSAPLFDTEGRVRELEAVFARIT